MVKHIMADGREIPDITKYTVTLNDKTEAAYKLLERRKA